MSASANEQGGGMKIEDGVYRCMLRTLRSRRTRNRIDEPEGIERLIDAALAAMSESVALGCCRTSLRERLLEALLGNRRGPSRSASSGDE